MCEKQIWRGKTGHHTSAALEEKFFASCQNSHGTSQLKGTNGRIKKKHHARLPPQVPASRVTKNPGGNHRQERMDAVSGQGDGKHQEDYREGKQWQWAQGGTHKRKHSTVFRNVCWQKAMVPREFLNTLFHRTLGKTT